MSAGLAAARAEAGMVPGVRFPAEDAGRSLAEIAQRDLDAALQLLADRAQYITGATGAAIALRRDGRNDMLCRASSGSSAPELGALLSTEFGLSGESVRTRQLLRCDDAERDSRVNRDVCRKLGISSVVVMPVVNDDEVLGVFELFSGHTHAFGERDVTAVQRLTEMVETAVRLAQAAEHLPEKLNAQQPATAETSAPAAEAAVHDGAEQILDEEMFGEATSASEAELAKEQAAIKEAPITGEKKAEATVAPQAEEKLPAGTAAGIFEKDIPVAAKAAVEKAVVAATSADSATSPATEVSEEQAGAAAATLHWSAPEISEVDGQPQSGEADQSHVPPVLRGLKKCAACGFPISGGRELCVECEEKKWRGQLRKVQPGVAASASASAPKVENKAFAAAAPNPVAGISAPLAASASATTAKTAERQPIEANKTAAPSATTGISSAAREAEKHETPATGEKESPTLVLTAAMEPQPSWLSASKYILGFMLLVAAIVGAVILLR